MLAYILRRILATLPVMGIVVVFVFLLVRIAPGDPAAIIAGDYATPENIQKIRVGLGLDRPIHVQFAIYVGNLLRGDLGVSLHSRLPVRQLIVQRLEPTLALALSTLCFAVLLAVPLGILAAWRAGSLIDRAVMVFAVGGFSIPIFWLGFLLIYVFSVKLDVLPVQGYVSFREGIVSFVKHLILPTLALGMVYMALLARITRATVLEVLQADYIRTGIRQGAAARHRALRPCAEKRRRARRDHHRGGIRAPHRRRGDHRERLRSPGLGPAHRGCGAAAGLLDHPGRHPHLRRWSYALVNLAVDLSYTLFDPRIRY